MPAVTAVLLALCLALLGAVLFMLWQVHRRLQGSESQSQSLALFQAQLEGLRSEMAGQLAQLNSTVVSSQSSLGQRMDQAAKVVGEVRQSLGSLGQATGQILDLGKDMNRELAGLQLVFQPPKMRGGVGEVLLANMLADMLPAEHYSLQHAFKSRNKVDAVIRLPEGMVPVDAKFPLENFRRAVELADEKERAAARREFIRDVKKHIDDISTKYILPDEGTLDFALMYVPAENVYYEAVLRDDEGELYRYAAQRRVIPVSPNSFYAYLSAMVRGFRGMKVAAQAQEILEGLERLNVDLARYNEAFTLVGKHLSNAAKAYADAEKGLARFSDKLGGLRAIDAAPRAELPSLPS